MKNKWNSTIENEKCEVPAKFDNVASSYDWLTSLNPGYRKHLTWSAKRLGLGPTPRILDLCCGTGISTEALLDVYPGAKIVALDASLQMLECAKRKRRLSNVQFIHGNAENPRQFGVNDSFDGIMMAYGIRNVPGRDTCLANILTLLRPLGRVCFHEYSVVDSRLASALWNLVSLGIIIPSGRLFSGDASIYRYLRRSVLEFDGVRRFEERLKELGFVGVHTEQMDGWQRNVLHSFVAARPEAPA
ncbi:MAG: class I SAM-dependent methyltransferase [Myxococcales bacterium]|nr:class I SAM-dependent methyltransferase [Myxococcales bacterium]